MSGKRWIQYFTSVRTEINFLLGACLTTVIAIDFIFSNVPEVFQGGAKLGSIVDRLCLSYISSYIFFFLVVHIKSQKDKENLYPYIAKKTDRIIGDAKSMIEYFKQQASCQLEDQYPALSEVEEMCRSIAPHGRAPLIIGGLGNYATWLQYLNYSKRRTEESISKIYLKMQFLDSEYLGLVVNIQDCNLFWIINDLSGMTFPITNTDLSFIAKEIHQYFEYVKLLEEYAYRKLKDYKD
jgi:hypothetical protein